MRWNCPHCGAALAVSDHRVESKWMFSTCNGCGGYSMVRPRARTKPRVIYAGSARARALAPAEPRTPAPVAALPQPLPAAPDGSKWKRNTIAAGLAIAVTTAVLAGALPRSAPHVPARARAPEIDSGLVIQALEPLDVADAVNLVPEDSIHQRAMAPDRSTPAESLLVRISVEDANLRSGPGLEHPVVGLGDPTVMYRITQWQGRWFEIVPQEHASLGVNEPAWIRNDLLDPGPN